MEHAIEVQSIADLNAALAAGVPPSRLRLQDLDLREHGQLLARADLRGMVVLGGHLNPTLEAHLRTAGALVFPDDAAVAPINPYRATLYRAEELYFGLAKGYAQTVDARAYRWAQRGHVHRDILATLLRAIHDDSISDALDEFVGARPVVGVMGGHDLARDTSGYAAAARLGCDLAGRGFLVATGGGPGAMEAANLGAACPDLEVLEAVLPQLAAVPHYAGDLEAWARSAFVALAQIRERASTAPTTGGSLGIPTWFYGHEPPNVFGEGIAKYFSNALREEGLLARANAGLIVLPGAAGTVQEVFQAATRAYYSPGPGAPLVLVGHAHWTQTVPAWPTLQALGRGRPMAATIHLVDTTDEARDVVSAASPGGT